MYEESLLRGLGIVDIAPTLEGLAIVAAALGETTWAVRLWASAAALRDSLGAPLPPVCSADLARRVPDPHAQLGEQAFGGALAAGSGRTGGQARVVRGPVTIL